MRFNVADDPVHSHQAHICVLRSGVHARCVCVIKQIKGEGPTRTRVNRDFTDRGLKSSQLNVWFQFQLFLQRRRNALPQHSKEKAR